MKFNTLGYTSKDIDLQGNYMFIIPHNEVFFKVFQSFLQNKRDI